MSNGAAEVRPDTDNAISAEPGVELRAVDLLDLDPHNARLPEDLTERTQAALLRHLEEAYGLEELAWSMAERGYFREEPLLTIASPTDGGRRIVVEGNRRLATLKLLTDAGARRTVGKHLWDEMAEFAAEQDLAEAPTRNYPDRESLLDYLGFRHVSGLLQWTPDAKARFVHRLVTEYGYSFERAGKVIGSRKDAIRRQFIAWRALEQARADDVDVAPAVSHFGVYYRALQNPSIRAFLKLEGWNDGSEELREPLGSKGSQRFGEFLNLVWGKKRVIRESRQLDDLGKVLANDSAYELLKQERDLAMALQELPVDRAAVYAAIRLAYRHAARANAEAWQFTGEVDLLAEARRLRDLVAQLLRTLEGKERPVSPEGA
jgi:hypothetical protein